MPKLRVHNFAVSLDGFGAGPHQDCEHPLGIGGERLHEWVWRTRTGRRMIGEDGGDTGVDDEFMTRGDAGIAATIMAGTCSGRSGGTGAQKSGRVGGATSRPTTTPSSS